MATGGSIENQNPNNVRLAPLANNFITKSMQGGNMPTAADVMDMPAG